VLDRLLALSKDMPIVSSEPGGARVARAGSRVQRVTDVHLVDEGR
jgi:hypothetical protein